MYGVVSAALAEPAGGFLGGLSGVGLGQQRGIFGLLGGRLGGLVVRPGRIQLIDGRAQPPLCGADHGRLRAELGRGSACGFRGVCCRGLGGDDRRTDRVDLTLGELREILGGGSGSFRLSELLSFCFQVSLCVLYFLL